MEFNVTSSCSLCSSFCYSPGSTWVFWRDTEPTYTHSCNDPSSSWGIYARFCAIRYRWRCDSSCLLELLFPSWDHCICTHWIPSLSSGGAVSWSPSRKHSGFGKGAHIGWAAGSREGLGPLERMTSQSPGPPVGPQGRERKALLHHCPRSWALGQLSSRILKFLFLPM